MNKSVLMIMGGALVVAMTVALIVQSKLSPKQGASAPATIDILVARKKMLVGENLKSADVRWQSWPEAASFQGVIRKSEQDDLEKLDVYGAPLRRNIEAGEPVTKQALIPDTKGGNNFLAALISPGMRAVAVSVKASTMAGGFVAPGDNVDIILSYVPRLPTGSEQYANEYVRRFASQTVLSNVRVLAVDQNAKDAEREAKIAKTVTIEVTQEGAQILALADMMGDITLALRRIGDKDGPRSVPVPFTTDSTTSDVVKRLNELVKQSRTSSNTVRMYNGTTIMNVPVRETPKTAGE